VTSKTANTAADPATIRFHRDARQRYLESWNDVVARKDDPIARAEVAFHVLEHTEMLFQCTGEQCLRAELRGSLQGELVLHACDRINAMTLIGDTRALLQADALDGDQIAEIEMILLRRHALQGVISLARELVDLADPGQRRALATAASAIAELDDVLLARPDAVSVASRILDPVRDELVVEMSPMEYWWLFWARDLDAAFETEPVPSDILKAAAPDPIRLRPAMVSQQQKEAIAIPHANKRAAGYAEEDEIANAVDNGHPGESADVFLIHSLGAGFAGSIIVKKGTTVSRFLSEHVPKLKLGSDCVLLVNRQIVLGSRLLENRDRVVITQCDIRAAGADDVMFGPKMAEQRTIDYLTQHLSEIIRHGTSDIWFALDSAGAIAAHTYDAEIATGFGWWSGPHNNPIMAGFPQMIEQDTRGLLDWITGELNLGRSVAEQVCLKLGWPR